MHTLFLYALPLCILIIILICNCARIHNALIDPTYVIFVCMLLYIKYSS